MAGLPGGGQLEPNLFVDVTETLDDQGRRDGMLRDRAAATTRVSGPSRALRERAAFWASHIGRPAAEPFAVLREVT